MFNSLPKHNLQLLCLLKEAASNLTVLRPLLFGINHLAALLLAVTLFEDYGCRCFAASMPLRLISAMRLPVSCALVLQSCTSCLKSVGFGLASNIEIITSLIILPRAPRDARYI